MSNNKGAKVIRSSNLIPVHLFKAFSFCTNIGAYITIKRKQFIYIWTKVSGSNFRNARCLASSINKASNFPTLSVFTVIVGSIWQVKTSLCQAQAYIRLKLKLDLIFRGTQSDVFLYMTDSTLLSKFTLLTKTIIFNVPRTSKPGWFHSKVCRLAHIAYVNLVEMDLQFWSVPLGSLFCVSHWWFNVSRGGLTAHFIKNILFIAAGSLLKITWPIWE